MQIGDIVDWGGKNLVVRDVAPRRFSIRKINKRLHIMDGDTPCYSPPNFLQLPNRTALQTLADAFNEKNSRCIDVVVEFESKYAITHSPLSCGYRGRRA